MGTSTQSRISGRVADVQWCDWDPPTDWDPVVVNRTGFLLTARGTLYRSLDGGASWIDQTSRLPEATPVTEVHLAPHDRDHVFLRGGAKLHWLSQDGGGHWEAVGRGESLRGFLWNPRLPGSALAHRDANGGSDTGSSSTEAAAWDALVSEDFGRSWRLLATGVRQYAWGGANAASHTKPAWHRGAHRRA